MGGEISTGGEFPPPFVHSSMGGGNPSPPDGAVTWERGGIPPPPLYLVLWGMEITPPLADLSQGKQKDPLEKYAFIQQNFHFLPTRPFPSARPKPALNTQTFRYLTEVVFGS